MSNDIDVNVFAETLNDKLDRDLKNSAFNMDLVIAYKAPTASDPTWYRQYKSGWVEQGGTLISSADAAQTITLPVTMQDTNYQVFTARNTTGDFSTAINGRWCEVYNLTTTTFTTWGTYSSMPKVFWEVKGFAANPEESGGDESTYGNVYKTYFYRNTDLDYDNMVGPYTPSQMASYSIQGSGVIMGYLNPDNSNNGRLKINNHVVWGADTYYTSVYIPVKKNDVFSYVGIDDPTTSGQLWFVPYLEPSQSTDPTVTQIVDAMYPIGSIYIGTTVNCPLASIVGTWTKIDGDLVLQSSSQTHQADTKIEAGVPNITGTVWSGDWEIGTNLDANGAFDKVKGSAHAPASSGQRNEVTRITFDASRSSDVYGNSNTVQPPAYVVNIWKRTA